MRARLSEFLLLALSFCVPLAGNVPTVSAAATKPNVLVILSDDQGWGDFSFNGNTNLSTPHVDSLARDGAQFERFYVCPVCSPTRAEFLTGRYHPRSGVHSTSTGGERMNLDEVTIADTFKAAGYATAAFGKWHNGQQYPYHANGRGFDEFYGFCSGHWANYFSPPLDRNGEIVAGRGYLEDDFTHKALDFMEQHRNQPFFAYVAFNSPHSPMQVPDEYWNRFKDKTLKLRGTNKENMDHTRAALAMCENLDWNVGRLLERLDKLGIADNTIVVYFCDNGPNGNRWNGGMKGIKGTTDEGGVRSPLVIRWPKEIVRGTRVPVVAGAIDLLPTLAAFARVPLIGAKPLDGINLAPLIRLSKEELTNGRAIPPQIRDRMLFSHWNARVSVCQGSFRLDHTGKLYDVLSDPGQRLNVGSQHAAVQTELAAAVKHWKDEVLPGIARDDRPFLVGHPKSKNTQLAAADAVVRGGIKRTSPHPNASYFTHWTTADDRITWDAEVLTSGDYAAEIYYTCPASDIGSTIELSFRDSRISGTVAEAHDPPRQGAEQDRVPRTESYTKDFRPMKLCTIHLEKGRGELTLQATKIPSSQVMDFRMLVLTRKSK